MLILICKYVVFTCIRCDLFVCINRSLENVGSKESPLKGDFSEIVCGGGGGGRRYVDILPGATFRSGKHDSSSSFALVVCFGRVREIFDLRDYLKLKSAVCLFYFFSP